MNKLIIKGVKLILGILFLPFWWLELLIPRNKQIILFGAWSGNKYSDNSKALFEYILKNEPKLKVYWITKDKKIYQKLSREKKPVLMVYSLKDWIITLQASVVINTCANDFNNFALHGVKQICLWHGMPLKKIEFDTKYGIKAQGKDGKISSKITGKIKKIVYPYTLYNKMPNVTVTSSEFFIPFLSSAFLLDKRKIWLTGLPRTDWFYKEKTESIIYNLRKKFSDTRIILYMPTFRFSLYGMEVYDPFHDKSFNLDKFIEFLSKENIVFMYKAHFFDQAFNHSLPTDRFILINDGDYDELYVLISNIDILITDYSSVYFDFLCLNKPAILTPFDYDFYIKEARDHYFDYNLLPSIKAYNWDELMNIIAEKKYYSLPKQEADKFCKYNDGHASERILQKTLELLDKSA